MAFFSMKPYVRRSRNGPERLPTNANEANYSIKYYMELAAKIALDVDRCRDPHKFFELYDCFLDFSEYVAACSKWVKMSGNPGDVFRTINSENGRASATNLLIDRCYQDAYAEIITITDPKKLETYLVRYLDKWRSVFPRLFPENKAKILDSYWGMRDAVSQGVFTQKAVYPMQFESVSNGFEFEEYISQLLLNAGFDEAAPTTKTGDYGVDVTAVRDGVKYAIQCKLYSQPVGNKAVQEVLAGMKYYKCHVGAVVTNSTFTRQAHTMANDTGILLWDGDWIATKATVKNPP